jgi:Ricin-type beta-trefoil lectin domain
LKGLSLARRAALVLACTLLWQGCTFPDYRIAPASSDGGSSTQGAGRTGAGTSSGGAAAAGFGGSSGSSAGTLALGGGGDGGLAKGGDAAGGAPQEPGELAGQYRLVAAHSSKCLDAAGPASADLSPTVEQHACDPSRPQSITLRDVGDGYYTFGIDGSADCVDVEHESAASKALIVRAVCNGGASQEWSPLVQDDGSYVLLNRLSGNCVDVPARSTSDVSLQQYACIGGPNQRWVFASLVPQPLPLIVDDFFEPESAASSAPFSMMASRNVGQACDGNRALGASGDCHVIAVPDFANGTTSAGATWLHPRGNWGSSPGLLAEGGATRIRFQGRGAQGGEKVSFKAGGIIGKAFEDTFAIDVVQIQLSTTWQTYSLDLTGMPYGSGIVGAFSWSVHIGDNALPLKFYIDDVVWD